MKASKPYLHPPKEMRPASFIYSQLNSMKTCHHYRYHHTTMGMKLRIILAIFTTLTMHHLSFTGVASITNHTAFPSIGSTGFSFRMVANNSFRYGNDGYMHLQHALHDILPPHPPPRASSSLENATILHPRNTNTRETLLKSSYLVVSVGTGNGRQNYYVKLDTLGNLMSWIQCTPCQPHSPQHGPLFNQIASPTFHYLKSMSHLCEPPYSHPEGKKCAFHLTGPGRMSVRGYLSQDRFGSMDRETLDFLFGCSHSTKNFDSEGMYAGVISLGRMPTSLVMQAAAQGQTQFSYCLFEEGKTNRQGFLRFGTDIPHSPRYKTTRILPALDAHESEYYLSLISISLGGYKLNRIRPEMFARNTDKKGGCVIDLGTPLTMMVYEAYKIIEEAIWSDLHHQKVERVKHPEFGLCFRATEATKGLLQSLSLQFSEDEAVMIFSPHKLFLMMHDKQGNIACLAMKPGHRTIIGAFQQMDMRLIYDVKESKISFASESCSEDTTKVD